MTDHPDLFDLADKTFFKIGEVAEVVGVKPYVLRYWESEFNSLTPQKSGQSKHRMYTREGFLYIGKNSLTSLPSTLGNLTNLVELDIARSGVMLEVPSSVFELRYLEKIYIDRTAMLPMNFRNNSRLNILFK